MCGIGTVRPESVLVPYRDHHKKIRKTWGTMSKSVAVYCGCAKKTQVDIIYESKEGQTKG